MSILMLLQLIADAVVVGFYLYSFIRFTFSVDRANFAKRFKWYITGAAIVAIAVRGMRVALHNRQKTATCLPVYQDFSFDTFSALALGLIVSSLFMDNPNSSVSVSVSGIFLLSLSFWIQIFSLFCNL